MVTYHDNGMASFTIKLPPKMQESIETYASEEKRKRSNAIIYLIDVGLDDPEIEPDEYERGDAEFNQISVSTKFSEVIREAESQADVHFDGVFSDAVRWAILSGLMKERGNEPGIMGTL